MPIWTPEKVWADRDVFVIGGGKSLEDFEWNVLERECTIGCNNAFEHGVDITKICYFGDVKFYNYYHEELSVFEGTVFTDTPSLYKNREKWLWILQRYTSFSNKALGWFSSTGSGAVSLAIMLGARRVFLLGFDMHLSEEGLQNWHPNLLDSPDAGIFKKFIDGMERLKVDLMKKHPNVEVINITDDSALNAFLKIGVKEFWDNRR